MSSIRPPPQFPFTLNGKNEGIRRKHNMPILIGLLVAATAFRGWLLIKQTEHTLPRLIGQFTKQLVRK